MSYKHNTKDTPGDFTLNIADYWTHDQIQIAMLADIRREAREQTQLLRRMVSVLECHNTWSIPHTLKRIDRRIAKNLPLRKKTGSRSRRRSVQP